MTELNVKGDKMDRQKEIHETGIGLNDRYHELIMAVGNKCKDETRHETALRYIKQAEMGNDSGIISTQKTIKEEIR